MGLTPRARGTGSSPQGAAGWARTANVQRYLLILILLLLLLDLKIQFLLLKVLLDLQMWLRHPLLKVLLTPPLIQIKSELETSIPSQGGTPICAAILAQFSWKTATEVQ